MLQKSLENLANLMVKERQITVILTDDCNASTDGHHIRLSLPPILRANPPEKVYKYLTTLLYHEVGHVLFSSFQVYSDTVFKYLSTFDSTDSILLKKVEHLIKKIFNAFEDVRVERLMSLDYPLAKDDFFELNHQLFALQQKHSREHEIVLDHLLSLAFLGNHKKLPNTLSKDAKSLVRHLRKRLPAIVSADSTSACLEMIISILKPYNPLLTQWASFLSLEELDLEPDYLTIPVYESVYAKAHVKKKDIQDKAFTLGDLYDFMPKITDTMKVIDCNVPPVAPPKNLHLDVLKLKVNIKHIFLATERQSLTSTSGQLNTRKLHYLMCFRTDLFYRKSQVMKKVAFSILVDISGSMKGDKLEKAFALAAIMEVALKDFGPLEIAAYSTHETNACHYIIKPFTQNVNEASYVWGFFQSGRYELRGNIEDENLKLAGERLLTYKAHQKILFVICDAVPCVDGTDHRAKVVVNKLKSEKVVTVALLLDIWNKDSENLKRAREIYSHVIHFKNETINPHWTGELSQILRRASL